METGVFIICLDIQEVSCTDDILLLIIYGRCDLCCLVNPGPARPPAYWELLVCMFACARTHINIRMFTWTVEVHGCESRAR